MLQPREQPGTDRLGLLAGTRRGSGSGSPSTAARRRGRRPPRCPSTGCRSVRPGKSVICAWNPRCSTASSPVLVTSRGEAHAARAQDAALLVQQHVRAELPGLLALDLLEREAALIQAVLHVVVLQRAFAGLVADGAIDRVVDEQELEHSLPSLADPIVLGLDGHAVADWAWRRRSEAWGCPRRRPGTCGSCRPRADAGGSRSAGPGCCSGGRSRGCSCRRGGELLAVDFELDLLVSAIVLSLVQS